ncbi:DUF2808 domain-containing protein [Moorena producens]|uniref:DUF2808 domain-containing protein n=1 Tax=Moorena producens TaxID=1155739 RepID=UPI003C76A52C
MLSTQSSIKRLISAIALAGCVLTGLSVRSLAQSNPGLVLWSGVKRENILRYHLDFNGAPNYWDRYRLRIPKKKMELGVAQFSISYPDYYDGKFDVDKIEVRVDGKSLPVSEVVWDKENYSVQIYMEEAVPANENVELVFSNVKNPDGGTYYFVCYVLAAGDIPLPTYVGTWIVSIGR